MKGFEVFGWDIFFWGLIITLGIGVISAFLSEKVMAVLEEVYHSGSGRGIPYI